MEGRVGDGSFVLEVEVADATLGKNRATRCIHKNIINMGYGCIILLESGKSIYRTPVLRKLRIGAFGGGYRAIVSTKDINRVVVD